MQPMPHISTYMYEGTYEDSDVEWHENPLPIPCGTGDSNVKWRPFTYPMQPMRHIRTYGDSDVERHVMDSGKVLLVVHIKHTVGEDLNPSVLRQGLPQLACPLQAVDKGARVAHDAMQRHDVRGCVKHGMKYCVITLAS